MTKLGFFGGSFNPPTYAHLQIAKTALEQEKLNKFFFIPVGNNYQKPNLIDEKHRYNMLKIICKNENNIFTDDIELSQNKNLSTIEAFKIIEEKYTKIYGKNLEINYIMGADNFIRLPNWKEAEQLITKYKYIVFKRDNLNLEQLINQNTLLNNNKENFKILTLNKYQEQRSSLIRNCIKNSNYEEAKKYTKPEVIEYIKTHNIYK